MNSHASCCVEQIILQCLTDGLDASEFTIASERYGCWSDDEVNGNLIGLDVYSDNELITDETITLGQCSNELVVASLVTSFELYTCKCEGSKIRAKQGLFRIQKLLAECWGDPLKSNMWWDRFAYQGYSVDGNNDITQVNEDMTVLIATYRSDYRYRLSQPGAILRGRK